MTPARARQKTIGAEVGNNLIDGHRAQPQIADSCVGAEVGNNLIDGHPALVQQHRFDNVGAEVGNNLIDGHHTCG